MAFNLEMYPISYLAAYDPASRTWKEQWIESDRVSYSELQQMNSAEKEKTLANRNQLGLPTVSYTSQYGYGCFEGMKAYPHKDGSVSIFRPDRNAARFAHSMCGLGCPVFPEEQFVAASVEFIRRNAELGYIPTYDSAWETDNFSGASAVYMRPFMNSEGAIGVGLSREPYVVICATTVSSYFSGANTRAVTTDRIRATPHGTGGIKCAANYVMSALAKKEAEDAGFMEVVFLDAQEHRYLQEGSSCNIFVYLKSGVLVTPELGDTILPGITRASVIDLARAQGITVEERPVSIEEAMADGAECFVTGTAAGITPIESITHNGTEAIYNNREPGPVGQKLQHMLKGIQYGALADSYGWNVRVK